MLEDDFTWVVRKAFKGLALAPGEAALRAGLAESEVLAFSRGKFDARVARGLAPVLGLNAEALANHPEYVPAGLEHGAITRLDMPFSDGQVNAWLVRAGGKLLLFDAGTGSDALAGVLGETVPDIAFITHGHGDHVGGMQLLDEMGVRCFGAGGGVVIRPGERMMVGDAEVEVFDLSGHADPSYGFLIGGLAPGVLVTGDAIFAGSIGGCQTVEAYRHALERIENVIRGLPPETILLPGHGPATSLGEEWVGNPFLAGMHRAGAGAEDRMR